MLQTKNKNILNTRLCQRKDRSGGFYPALVVNTTLSNPLKTADETILSQYRKLVSDLQAARALSGKPFAGYKKIEIRGPRWRAVI